jgi:hypothetical protein
MPNRSLLTVAVVVWSAAILVAVFVGSAFVLAMLSPEPNWSEITLALATVVLALATVGLTVAAFFALGSIGEARKARNADQMTELSRRWDEEKNRDVRHLVKQYAENGLPGVAHVAPPGPDRLKEVVIKLKNDNSPDYRKLMTDPNILEDIAIMVDYGGIDFDIVNLSLGYQIAYRWKLWEPTVVALRDEIKVPDAYVNFANLAKRIAAVNPQSVRLENGEIVWEGFKD